MKLIPLSQGKGFVQVDDEDYELLSQYPWRLTKDGYAITYMPMHRMVMGMKRGFMIDHKDRNGLNNQKHNLRHATARQNSRNQSKLRTPTSSVYIGVSKRKDITGRRKNLWKAQIRPGKTNTMLVGYFDNERHAAMARDIWAIETYGEFANLNLNYVCGTHLKKDAFH